jgi:hypothetical protein
MTSDEKLVTKDQGKFSSLSRRPGMVKERQPEDGETTIERAAYYFLERLAAVFAWQHLMCKRIHGIRQAPCKIFQLSFPLYHSLNS